MLPATCRNCGADLPGSPRVCPACGTDQGVPAEQGVSPETQTVGMSERGSTQRYCPSCGQAAAAPEDRFCRNCGYSLDVPRPGEGGIEAERGAVPPPPTDPMPGAWVGRGMQIFFGGCCLLPILLLFVIFVVAALPPLVGGSVGRLTQNPQSLLVVVVTFVIVMIPIAGGSILVIYLIDRRDRGGP